MEVACVVVGWQQVCGKVSSGWVVPTPGGKVAKSYFATRARPRRIKTYDKKATLPPAPSIWQSGKLALWHRTAMKGRLANQPQSANEATTENFRACLLCCSSTPSV